MQVKVNILLYNVFISICYSFFSCTSSDKLCKRNEFLSKAKVSLSHFEYNLFKEILCEWKNSLFLHSCFSKWQKSVPISNSFCSSSLFHVLSFNVRGLHKRWQEIILLDSSFHFGVNFLCTFFLMVFFYLVIIYV